MCPKAKMKICLMTQATVILSVSVVTQVISFFIPYWVHIEMDGNYTSDGIYKYNKTKHYTNFHHKLEDNDISDVYDDNEMTLSWWNLTSEVEHRANRSYALWYIGTCIDGTCYADLYPEEINGSYNIQSYYEPGYNFTWVDSKIPFSKQKKFQIYVTIALVVSFVTVIFIYDQRKRYKYDTGGHISQSCHSGRIMMALGLILVSGILLWVPSLEYGVVNNKLFALEHKKIFDSVDSRPVTIHTPIALIFAAVSLISLALAFLSVFVAYLIKRQENQARRAVTLAFIPLEYRGAPQSVQVSSPLCQSVEQSDYAHGGDIFANPREVGCQVEDNIRTIEPPPPSYEETMRLYELETRDESRKEAKDN